jgi:hypothetical protein
MTREVPLRFTEWTHATQFDNRVDLVMPHWIRDGVANEERVSLFSTTLPLDGSKTVRMITLPVEPRLEIYAVTLVSARPNETPLPAR